MFKNLQCCILHSVKYKNYTYLIVVNIVDHYNN